MARRLRVAMVGFLLLGFFGSSLRAQSESTTGVIEGSLLDASGAALPGAAVSIRNTATNFEQVQTTDSRGRFRGLQLPPGPYRITVTLSGFATLVRDGVNLAVGQTLTLSLKLELSTVRQEVKVTAEAPVVETSRTAGATRIDEHAVQQLPNAAHNFLDFTKLTPGVTVVQGPDGDELSINGQKGINNNISVDGADFNNPFFGEQRGGQRPPFTFNLDAVQEVVVIADGANAEFGRSSGGFVNVVTKSGTNDIHASGHLYYKSDALASRAAKPSGGEAEKFDFDRYQAGATLGGPFQADKLFYFLAADAQRGRSTKQTDPTRIEQRVVDYFASVGSPNENGPIQRTDDALVILAKVDWHANPMHLATLRFAYTWSEQKNGTFDVDSWGRSANATEKDFSKALTGTLLSSFTPTHLNEFRFQLAREDRPRPYEGPDITGQSRPLPDTAFDFAKSYRFGEPFFIPVTYYDTRVQLNDNFTFLAGSHTVKAGVEWNDVVSRQTFVGFANGRYIFSSTDGFLAYTKNPKYVECSTTSTGFVTTTSQTGTCPPSAPFIVGPVLLFLQQAGVGGLTAEQAGTQAIRQQEPAVFVQDTWQPLPNLTINAGLRWEAQLEPDPITPPDKVFYAPFIGKTSKGQQFPSDGTIPSDKKMWQPRIGISWDPTRDGLTVVRGNFGIFYARVPGLNVASSRSTNGSVGQTLFRNSALTGVLGPVPAYPNLIPQSQIGSPFLPDVFVFDKNFKNPKTTSFGLGVERELIADMAAILRYNYARGDNITRFVNRNDPELGSPWGSGLAPGGANGINTLTTVESSAKSRYWGVTVGINKRLSNRFGFQVYYTYSKDKSDDDNERDPFSFRYAKIHEDPSNPTSEFSKEYGYSDRDQRHRVNSWFLWQAPGAVEVNVRYAYRSAQPKSIKADGTDANTPQDRINADGTVTQRNLGRKDNVYSSLDLRLSREFQFSGLTLEPTIEVFNLFNSHNFLSPEVTNLVFNFDGTIRSGNGDPRQLQLGVRVLF